MPSTLKALDVRAFECINSFNEVYIPKSITAIPAGCFNESSFEKIIFEDETVVTEIAAYAFAYSNIKNFHWPSGCNYISSYCFVCSMLEEITGTEHITAIGYEAFIFSKLKKFDWPAKCRCIPYHCFYGSTLSALSGIENVIEIGEGAFAETKKLTGAFSWPKKCTVIHRETFLGSSISSISNIENVTLIEPRAFAETKNLTGTFNWPQRCTKIYGGTFESSAITGISGIEEVAEIHRLAFANSKLKSIALGENLNYLSLFALINVIYEGKFVNLEDANKLSFDIPVVLTGCTELIIDTEGNSKALELFKENVRLPFDLTILVK